MKQEKRFVLTEYIHSDLDGKTIDDAIKFLESLSKLYESRSCTKAFLDWDGDRLNLIGTRLETDEEEQWRTEEEEADKLGNGVRWQRSTELAMLAHLKAKYEPEIKNRDIP